MKKEFWDLEESIGFKEVKSRLDSLYYKVWNKGNNTSEVALVLSKVRRDINKLLTYLLNNKELWINKPIAYGVVHTIELHLLNGNDSRFNYQEMTPNKHGILGLNKPKVIKTIEVNINGKIREYEIAEKRSIFLTIRNQITWEINDYSKIMDLAIHELTHTTCNDVRWKTDNHRPPYQSYHTLMRKWARECGIMN